MRSLALTAALLCCAVTAQATELIDYPVVQLRALDKITARTVTFQAKVGSTVKFGALYIKPQACRKASPIDPPESTSFVQIWESTAPEVSSPLETNEEKQPESKWVFSGWMFASSPALSAMDHPVYDVWVLDCLNRATEKVSVENGTLGEDEGEVKTEAAVSPDLPEVEITPVPAAVAQ